MIGCMFTSLKVVSMAVVCCTSTSRLAMLARMRVMGTRFSGRSPSGMLPAGAWGAAAWLSPPPLLLAVGAGSLPFWSAARWTSSLRTRPPLPVASTFERSTPFSSAIFFAAGLTSGSSPLSPSFSPEAAGSDAGSSFVPSDSLAPDPASSFASPPPAEPDSPSANLPITSPLSTVSPSFLTISLITPSPGATTSSTTLSVSISTISSSRSHCSPGFLCQVAIVPSATDSGKTGA